MYECSIKKMKKEFQYLSIVVAALLGLAAAELAFKYYNNSKHAKQTKNEQGEEKKEYL